MGYGEILSVVAGFDFAFIRVLKNRTHLADRPSSRHGCTTSRVFRCPRSERIGGAGRFLAGYANMPPFELLDEPLEESVFFSIMNPLKVLARTVNLSPQLTVAFVLSAPRSKKIVFLSDVTQPVDLRKVHVHLDCVID